MNGTQSTGQATPFDAVTLKALKKFLIENSDKSQASKDLLQNDSNDSLTETYKALQVFLNNNWEKAGFRKLKLNGDGTCGTNTVKALQTLMNGTREETKKLKVDGELGPLTLDGLKEFLNIRPVEPAAKSGTEAKAKTTLRAKSSAKTKTSNSVNTSGKPAAKVKPKQKQMETKEQLGKAELEAMFGKKSSAKAKSIKSKVAPKAKAEVSAKAKVPTVSRTNIVAASSSSSSSGPSSSSAVSDSEVASEVNDSTALAVAPDGAASDWKNKAALRVQAAAQASAKARQIDEFTDDSPAEPCNQEVWPSPDRKTTEATVAGQAQEPADIPPGEVPALVSTKVETPKHGYWLYCCNPATSHDDSGDIPPQFT